MAPYCTCLPVPMDVWKINIKHSRRISRQASENIRRNNGILGGRWKAWTCDSIPYFSIVVSERLGYMKVIVRRTFSCRLKQIVKYSCSAPSLRAAVRKRGGGNAWTETQACGSRGQSQDGEAENLREKENYNWRSRWRRITLLKSFEIQRRTDI